MGNPTECHGKAEEQPKEFPQSMAISLWVQELLLNGETLINPMSIVDYDDLMTDAAQVSVKIPAGAEYTEYTARLAERAAATEGKSGEGKQEGKAAASESKQ